MSLSLDQRILLQIQETFSHPVLDKLAYGFHHLITDEGITFTIPIMIWALDPAKGMVILLGLSLTEIVNGALKWYFQRPRPFWELSKCKNVLQVWEQDYSFPSSHAQVASTWLFGILLEFHLNWTTTAVLILAAFLCGLFRIYNGVHYPSCVLTGWAVGFLVPVLLKYLDVVDWFSELKKPAQFTTALCLFIIPFTLLALIRHVIPPPTAQKVREWEKNANKVTETTKRTLLIPRRLTKYLMQTSVMLGGAIGAIYLADDLRHSKLRFLEESCDWKYDSDSMIKRLSLGYAVLITIFAPAAFILPKKISSTVVSTGIKVSAFVALSFWLIYLNPLLSKKAGWECPIFRCTDEDIKARTTSDFTPFVDYRGQQHHTLCMMDFGTRRPVDFKSYDMESIQEIQTLIQKARDENKKIRVIGAGRSSSFRRFTSTYDPNTIWISLATERF